MQSINWVSITHKVIFVKVPVIKWLKSTRAKITVYFHWVLEACVGLCYRGQGQRFERATVHYAHLHLALCHEICTNKITQHLTLLHSSKSTYASINSSVNSQVPFLKGQKGNFFVCVTVSFSPQWWSEHKCCCDRGQNSSIFQLKHLDEHFLSVVQRLCLPQFSLFM